MYDREQSLSRKEPSSLCDTERARILVVGTRLSGAVDLEKDFEEYINELNLPNPPKVEWLRDINRLPLTLTGYPDKQGGMVPKVAQGVVLMREVRVYVTPDSPGSYDTYSSGIDTYVADLCMEKGIPLVMLEQNYSRGQIIKQMGCLSGLSCNG